MESFIAADEQKAAQGTPVTPEKAVSVVPRVEENYGSFTATVDLGELLDTALSADGQPASGAAVVAASSQPVTGAKP